MWIRDSKSNANCEVDLWKFTVEIITCYIRREAFTSFSSSVKQEDQSSVSGEKIG